MVKDKLHKAAELLIDAQNRCDRISLLPSSLRPVDLIEGYRIQDIVTAGSDIVGWKIAATSRAGQIHIGIDHPIAGQLASSCILHSGDTALMTENLMLAAEAEFVIEYSPDLPARDARYEIDEVMSCVGHLRIGIELPDSRYHLFAKAGAPQLVADNACASQFVLGVRIDCDWRKDDLGSKKTSLYVDGGLATEGYGSDALGDPRAALTWLVNHVSERRIDLLSGQFVTTGVCGDPTPIGSASHVRVDIEGYGEVEVNLLNEGMGVS